MRKRSLMGFFFFWRSTLVVLAYPKQVMACFFVFFFLASDGNGNAAGRTG